MTTITHTTPQYQPVYKPGQLICGTGQTVVVTGWTVKQTVAKHLRPDEFAAIGQLYSPTRGISLLIRNLLANPQVRFLVVLNATKEDRNAGGSECLLDFLRYGFEPGQSDTGRDCWRVRSPIPGYIDREIPAPILEQLREALTWQAATSIAEAIAQTRAFTDQGWLEPWGEPLLFPIAAAESSTLPGPRYGHRIEGKTIAQTWVKIIHRIKTTGTIRPTGYDNQWQELVNLMAIVTDEPPGFYFPEPNYLPCDRAFIDDYIGQILEDAPQREGVKYTYGQRLRSWFQRDQIEQVIEKLAANLESTRAVMSLWDVQDHEANDSPPCLNHLWVRVADRALSLTATFRSNDMFSAWPANAMGLRALQQHLREQIEARSQQELALGPLITISQSAHIYDDCWENADQLIETQYPRVQQQRDYNDPTGNFVISVQADQIVVEHLTPGTGEVVQCYAGQSAKHLYQQIAAACPGLQLEHAMYLGTELQKAELSLGGQQDWIYEQDRPLRRLVLP